MRDGAYELNFPAFSVVCMYLAWGMIHPNGEDIPKIVSLYDPRI